MLSKDKIPRCKYYGGTSSRTMLHRQSHSIPRLGCYGKHHNTYILLPFCILALLVVGWSMISPSTINVSHVVNAMESDGVYAEEGSINAVDRKNRVVDVAEDNMSTFENTENPDNPVDNDGASNLDTATTNDQIEPASISTRASVNPTASLTVASASLASEALMPGGGTGYVSSNITYSANDISSYAIKISYASGSSTLAGSTTIGGAGGKVGSNLDNNTWGYALADTNTNNAYLTYNTMPAYGSGTTIVSGNAESVPTTTKKLVFAAKFGEEAKAGHYQARVMLSMVATPKALLFAGIDNMQQMTTQICKDAKIGDTTTLKDTRDNSTYTIRKHEDNNCWMTENLRLVGPKTLTPNDSDISNNYTTAASINGGVSNNAGTGSTGYPNFSKDNGRGLDQSFYRTDTLNTNGVYYSFTAATAGKGGSVGDAEVFESICPKGWTLPPYRGSGSYANLISSAGITNDISGATKFKAMPYHFATAGRIYEGELHKFGEDGYYWTRNARSMLTSAFVMNLLSGSGVGMTSLSRYEGVTMRCVALGN